MAEEQDVRALDYLYETGLLKRYRRTGWVVAGVAAPESIADHSPDGHRRGGRGRAGGS